METYLNTNNHDYVVPNVIVSLLQKYDDVFSGVPVINAIEQQMDLVLEALIPNSSAYRSNPEKIKEL